MAALSALGPGLNIWVFMALCVKDIMFIYSHMFRMVCTYKHFCTFMALKALCSALHLPITPHITHICI